ncbi:MAG: hemolysin III family protein [Candidatus Peribacteraceae bacterium]|nr:hemolysin III family protein [Candidatus Peribacteraceae bacterium]MDD5740015.1 hemolysin III family protein [Candidatus Peribacteraceae bacterium]
MRKRVLEEAANSITHAIGFGLSVTAFVLLIIRASGTGNAWLVVGVSLYGAALVVLYLASTLYHSLERTKAGSVLQRIDRSAIYILIAGTYTPFTLTTLRGGWGWSLFGVIWGFALIGILLVTVSVRKYPLLTCALYLLMGWLVVIAIVPAIRVLPSAGIAWLLTGGILYSTGVLFFISNKFLAHTAWHVMVLAASVCHFFAVLTIVHP